MQILQTEEMNAQVLNQAIMRMAGSTAEHQWPEKLAQEIIARNLNTPTLAVATASLQSNSQVIHQQTEHIRSLMKIMLDSQILNDQLEAQSTIAGLMKQQIDTQVTLAAASKRQAKASSFLGWVSIVLAIAAVILAGVQVAIALKVIH